MHCLRIEVGTLLLWATALAAPGKVTVPVLPRPTGPFAVGRIGFDWTDRSRREVLSKDADAKRELMIYVWYPTRKGARPVNLLPTCQASLRSTRFLIMNYLEPTGNYGQRSCPGELASHAVEGATPARNPARFPVLMFCTWAWEPGISLHRLHRGTR